jgi:hypothetical protein
LIQKKTKTPYAMVQTLDKRGKLNVVKFIFFYLKTYEQISIRWTKNQVINLYINRLFHELWCELLYNKTYISTSCPNTKVIFFSCLMESFVLFPSWTTFNWSLTFVCRCRNWDKFYNATVLLIITICFCLSRKNKSGRITAIVECWFSLWFFCVIYFFFESLFVWLFRYINFC